MKRHLTPLVILLACMCGIGASAQFTTVSVRFANPVINCATQSYTLDVEFQADVPNTQLFGMNVRFFYDEDVLEFTSLGDFAQGYGQLGTVSVYPLGAASGPQMFGFSGAAEWVNGSIQLFGASSVYLPTNGWVKLFNITFGIDDPNACNDDFCPSVVWDLEEDPLQGGFLPGDAGVLITVNVPPNGTTEPAIENVIQFNWDYDGIPGEPYGYPDPTICVAAKLAPSTIIMSAKCNNYGYVTFPVMVEEFVDINAFTLTVDYDPAVLEYCCSVPNSAVAANFDTTTFYPGRIQMSSSGFNTTLTDGSVLFHTTFKYLGGSCDLTFYNNDTSCQYVDAINGLPLPDLPTAEFYVEGTMTPGYFNWTGAVSSDWQDQGNWQSGLVPGPFDEVFISSTPLPPHYPVFTGDLSLGTHCRNLTLNGGAELEVTGDVSIGPGNALTITDTGKITLSGDWVNSGTFAPGLGEVIFGGSGDGNIGGSLPASNYISALALSTFPQGMVNLTGGHIGPTGDDGHMNVNIGFTFSYLGVDYSQVRISTNGWVSLNLSGNVPESKQNDNLFSDIGPSTVLAPWWDDMRIDSGADIYYLTEGEAPNRVFTVEWNEVLAYRFVQNMRLNFQVKLYESTNVIEFCYGSISGTVHNQKESASIGLKDATGGPGHFLEVQHGTSHLMAGCLLTDQDWPDVNYRFSPPVAEETQTFHQLSISKDSGELRISQNVVVTGID